MTITITHAPTGRDATAHTWTSPDDRPHTIISRHDKTPEGNPHGGFTEGPGLSIQWQRGPINAENPQNGALIEEVILAVIDRIDAYQASQFATAENALAQSSLYEAVEHLYDRIRDRVARGVQGSYQK